MIALALCLLLQEVPLEHDPWLGLKVDSWVKCKITRPASTDEVKQTLKEINATSKRIERDPPRPVNEDDDGTTVTFTAFSKALTDGGLRAKSRGKETLAGGIAANLFEYVPADADDKAGARWRVWYSDDLPGGIAKIQSQTDAESGREKIACEVKGVEKLKIGSKTVSAHRFEVQRVVKKDDKVEATYWLSREVPGLIVRLQERTTNGKLTSEVILETVDFEAKK